jgi:hypothetical protein
MEKVVSKKVLGSANPIARKFRDLKGAIQGIGCGFLSLIIGIVLIVSSVTSIKENSKLLANTPLQTPQEVENKQEFVKVQAQPSDIEKIEFKFTICENKNCYAWQQTEETFEDFLYLDAKFERFEVVEKTRTETRTRVENGQDIEETVEITEYKEEWVTKNQNTLKPYFSLGAIQINPEKATYKINTLSKTFTNIMISNLEEINTYGQQVSEQVGQTRLVVEYLKPENTIIATGDISSNTISSGEPFIISNKTDAELIETLKTEESAMRWGLRIGAWLLLTIGFSMILAPLMEIVDIIPVLGKFIKFVAFAISAFLSLLIVLILTLLIKYWYLALLLFILIFVGIAFLVIKLLTSKKERKVATDQSKESEVKE